MNTKAYTIVLGASENPERYANKAIKLLLKHDQPIIAIGNKSGRVEDIEFINTDLDQIIRRFDSSVTEKADTVTLYLGPTNQEVYYGFILALRPRRIIFNPGTENKALVQLAEAQGIVCEDSCTLVLLNLGEY